MYKKNLLAQTKPTESKRYITDAGELNYNVAKNTFTSPANGDRFVVKYWLEEVNNFDDLSKAMMDYLIVNHHPNVTVITTPMSSEILEGKKSVVNIY